jgi:hypothetical protein
MTGTFFVLRKATCLFPDVRTQVRTFFEEPAQKWMSGRFLSAHPFFAVQNPFPVGISHGIHPGSGKGYGDRAGFLHPFLEKANLLK